MDSVKINIKNPSKESLEIIASSLKKGQVIAYPTDTIHGLGCLASKKRAIKKIREIKGRGDDKPMLVLVKCFTMLRKYFYVDKRQMEYLKKIWPGKISVILKHKSTLTKNILGSAEAGAVRLPNNTFLVKMIRMAGEPIVSTSLNKSGEKPLSDISEINKHFKEIKPDLVIDAGKKLKGKPSRLIDLRDIDNIKIIRK
jgi:L-threonylcarbamoyladenylate synthase